MLTARFFVTLFVTQKVNGPGKIQRDGISSFFVYGKLTIKQPIVIMWKRDMR